MANEEHLAILKQGVSSWNQWRNDMRSLWPDLIRVDLRQANLSGVDFSKTDLIKANLSEANLSRVDLTGADLTDADLTGADLTGAYLYAANLRGADLTGADLSHADLSDAFLSGANISRTHLSRADLTGTDLSRVDLSRADLRGAHFTGADLTGADLSYARLCWTHFADVDLSEGTGLDRVEHLGPSYIDIHTIYKSKGNISEAFLRGAGTPDNFITYMKSMTSTAFDFYSCFISYSSKDQGFAERLHNDLQAKGVRCWFAPHDIQGGRKIHEQIDHAIRVYDKLLLILSKHSMKSKWVDTEVYKARKREETEKRRMLFPISLVEHAVIQQWEVFNTDSGQDMAREVRDYYIPDFTDWKNHEAYQKEFDKLLRDLKTQ